MTQQMSNWNIKGAYVEACNCETACPCIFFSPPTDNSCTVMLGWHIDQGEFEGITLDGLNAALLVHSPGNMKDGEGEKVSVPRRCSRRCSVPNL